MAEANTYTLEWESKPLGFSIVMDTTGKNAYVSSIQKEANKQRGLKLAAQIVKINGENVKNMEHKKILEKIKKATLPIKLMFQPRSFANEPESADIPTPIEFKGATVNEHRINGFFELTKEKYFGRHQWQRNDQETDPIILWFWPQQKDNADSSNQTGRDLWMIGRRSQQNTENAYACCEASKELPTDIQQPWECFQPGVGFKKCEITISQSKQ